MRCGLGGGSDLVDGNWPLVARGRGVIRGGRYAKFVLGAPQVPWGRVEDGIFLGKTGSPAATGRLVGVGTAAVLGCFKDGTREDGGCWGLFRRGRLSVWITKARGGGIRENRQQRGGVWNWGGREGGDTKTGGGLGRGKGKSEGEWGRLAWKPVDLRS